MYKYFTYLPANKENKLPVLFFLHGAPQRGNNFDLIKKTALPFFIEKKIIEPEFLIVVPQCPSNETWDTKKIYEIFLEIYKNYKIDRNRVYITGFSMGGFGSLKFAVDYPKIVTAVASVCGGGTIYMADFLKEIPVIFYHGRKDKIIEFEKTFALYDRLKKISSKEVILIEYKDKGHEIWNDVYSDISLYKWLLSHKK